MINGRWTKWCNNLDHVNTKCPKFEQDITAALTHFSYHVSGGSFALVDIQGSQSDRVFLLSDPCFVSSLPAGGLLGPTDIGAASINSFFFETHKECNKYCGKDWKRPEDKLIEFIKVKKDEGSSTSTITQTN